MTTAKSEVLIGLLLKNCYQWGQWTFGGGSLLGQILASEGDFPHHASRENPV